MKTHEKHTAMHARIILCLVLGCLISWPCLTGAQKNKPADKKVAPAFISGVYRNLFLEAGYKQGDIDRKINKAYTDLFCI